VERLDQLSAETLHLGGPRQCLRIDVFPDVCEFSVSNGYCEDPMILESLVRRFNRPLGESDDENPISLHYELRRCRVGNLRRFGSLLKQARQPRVPTVCAGERPVLARNDPLDVFGGQSKECLPIAAPQSAKKSITI